jgi:Flp pilus assembly protein TadD
MGARQKLNTACGGSHRHRDHLPCRLGERHAMVRAGQDDAALALAKDLEQPGQKAYVFHWVALAQARAGRKDAAKVNFDKAIELAANKGTGGTSLHNIASAQALAGDFPAALKTAAGAGSLAWANVAYA